MSLATLVYGFLFGVSALIYLILRQLEASTSPSIVFCVYGYSLAVFLPASVSELRELFRRQALAFNSYSND